MKRSSILLVFLFLMFSGKSYSDNFYNPGNSNTSFLPDTNYVYAEIDSLVILLTGGLRKDIDKVRSVFIWIANNITYDLERFNERKREPAITTQKDQTQAAQIVFETRLALCEGYSNLLKYMCNTAGVQAEIVEGIGRPQEKTFDMHGWNAVKIDNEWYLLDVTWAAGGISEKNNSFVKKFDNKFYLLSTGEFIKSHYPFDPMWQLLFNPITKADFENEIFESKEKKNFNFNDTIDLYFVSDSISRLLASNRRAFEYDRDNFVARKNYESLLNYRENEKMKYSNHLADTGIAKYNECIEIINRARKLKRPSVLDNSESQLKGLLHSSLQLLEKSMEIYEEIKFTDSQNIQILNQNLDNIKFNLKQANELKKYLEKYFNTPKAMRMYAL